MANPKGTDLVNEAKKWVGSHYLWGSGGARPGVREGYMSKVKVVDFEPISVDPADPSIFAAVCNVAGYHVCAGRYQKISGGRTATASDGDLKQYLTSVQTCCDQYPTPKPDMGALAHVVPNFYAVYTPRALASSPRGAKGVHRSPSTIVWGEDCRDVAHFDCIGFVNYCMGKVIGKPEYGMDITLFVNRAKEVGKATPDPGDILLRNVDTPNGPSQHIGIMGDKGQIIQAVDTSKGVHDDSMWSDDVPKKFWTHVLSNWPI